MKEAKLIGSLLLSHEQFLPILNKIRDKYDIPEISPEDDGITEILLVDEDIDWDEVHQEIKEKINNLDELFPAQLQGLMKLGNNLTESPNLPEEFNEIPANILEQILPFIQSLLIFLTLISHKIDEFKATIASHLFELLITGEAREIPQDWIGVVMPVPFFDEEPFLVAMATRLSDRKEIMDEFCKQFNQSGASQGDINWGIVVLDLR
jgi:hypothetical protein